MVDDREKKKRLKKRVDPLEELVGPERAVPEVAVRVGSAPGGDPKPRKRKRGGG